MLACSCPVPCSVIPMCLCSEPPSLWNQETLFLLSVSTKTMLYCLAASSCFSFTSVYMVWLLFFLIFELTDRVLLCFVLFSSMCKCCKKKMYIFDLKKAMCWISVFLCLKVCVSQKILNKKNCLFVLCPR